MFIYLTTKSHITNTYAPDFWVVFIFWSCQLQCMGSNSKSQFSKCLLLQWYMFSHQTPASSFNELTLFNKLPKSSPLKCQRNSMQNSLNAVRDFTNSNLCLKLLKIECYFDLFHYMSSSIIMTWNKTNLLLLENLP